MFGTKKGNINARLEEGRSWVRSLEADVKLTQTEADTKEEEITKLTQERTDLDTQIEEGTQVANNFKKMLVMDNKD